MNFKIALRNVLRNKRRSGLTFASIALGLALILVFQGLISGMDTQITDNFIRAQAGHIQVYHEGYIKKARLLSLDNRISDPDALIKSIKQAPDVKEVAERIRFGALVGTRRESVRVMGLGIDPSQEQASGTLASSVIDGAFLDGKGGSALIGRQLAEDLGFGVGNVLLVVGNTAKGSLNAIDVNIQGIINTGYAQLDNSTIILDLKDAQRLLAIPGEVTELDVMLRDLDSTDSALLEITTALSGQPVEMQSWKESGAAIWQLLQLRRWLLSLVSLVVVIIAGLGIANTMLMSVFERTREIGTLMALGNTPGEVLRLFMTESAIIGGAGGLFGCALGGGIVKLLATKGLQPPGSLTSMIDLPIGTTIYAHFSWETLLIFFTLALIVGVLSALYPAVLASRQEPVEALRHI
jgi:putative ABC transport system permease protein